MRDATAQLSSTMILIRGCAGNRPSRKSSCGERGPLLNSYPQRGMTKTSPAFYLLMEHDLGETLRVCPRGKPAPLFRIML